MWRLRGPMFALTWMDKKAVHAAGSNHKAPTDNLPTVNRKKKYGTVEQVPCHDTVSTYNVHMGDEDKNYQMKSYYNKPCAGKNGRVGSSMILLTGQFTTVMFWSKSPVIVQLASTLKQFRIKLAKQ